MKRLNCEEAVALLHDYLKQELTPELIVEVRQHMDRCRDCFDHLKFEESFFQKLEICAKRHTCPGELRKRILAALRAEEQGT